MKKSIAFGFVHKRLRKWQGKNICRHVIAMQLQLYNKHEKSRKKSLSFLHQNKEMSVAEAVFLSTKHTYTRCIRH